MKFPGPTRQNPNPSSALALPLSPTADMHPIGLCARIARSEIRLDPFGPAQEVPNSEHIDRGLNYELTDLKIGDAGYVSLAFEAFPDDSEMPEQFVQIVTSFLAGFDLAAFDGVSHGRTQPG